MSAPEQEDDPRGVVVVVTGMTGAGRSSAARLRSYLSTPDSPPASKTASGRTP